MIFATVKNNVSMDKFMVAKFEEINLKFGKGRKSSRYNKVRKGWKKFEITM